jgi:hypothetical protein|tara:strand:- start:1389 stop:1580 length:192 start_codon:yes stop_codon:yes gene_type:complete
MPYKNKPYQYLLTFPKDTKNSWDEFVKISKRQGRPVSELARQVIKAYVKEYEYMATEENTNEN